jgi:hypothetical protein
MVPHSPNHIIKSIQLLLLIFIFKPGSDAMAQFTAADFNITEDDTSYIDRAPSKWSIRLYSVLKFQQFGISSNQTNNAIGYAPNKFYAFGMGFSRNALNLDLAFFEIKKNVAGDTVNKSKAFDFVGSLYAKAHLFEAHLHKSTGLYGWINENGGGILASQDIDIPYRPDISITALGINYNYLFNSGKITFGSISGLEIQKKSAGGPMAGVFFSVYDLHADSAIVPVEYDTLFESHTIITDAFMVTAGISAGYAYTFVLPKHFYLTLSLAPGVSVTRGELKANDEWYIGGVPVNISYKLISRGAFGYAGIKFYALISVVNDRNFLNISNDNYYLQDINKSKLVFGYRF